MWSNILRKTSKNTWRRVLFLVGSVLGAVKIYFWNSQASELQSWCQISVTMLKEDTYLEVVIWKSHPNWINTAPTLCKKQSFETGFHTCLGLPSARNVRVSYHTWLRKILLKNFFEITCITFIYLFVCVHACIHVYACVCICGGTT